MPVNHHVLICFNLAASKRKCLLAAERISLSPEKMTEILDASDDESARKITYSAILNKICTLKELINTPDSVLIYHATWSENTSTIKADRVLTDSHSVTHKIEMEMRDQEAVEIYFNHPAHLALVDAFKEIAAIPDGIFSSNHRGFAIPFDSERPITPRTATEMLETGRDFLAVEHLPFWATQFVGTTRAGDFSRDLDLQKLADTYVSKGKPEGATVIRNAIAKSHGGPGSVAGKALARSC